MRFQGRIVSRTPQKENAGHGRLVPATRLMETQSDARSPAAAVFLLIA
jgi:hypothetical protein